MNKKRKPNAENNNRIKYAQFPKHISSSSQRTQSHAIMMLFYDDKTKKKCLLQKCVRVYVTYDALKIIWITFSFTDDFHIVLS